MPSIYVETTIPSYLVARPSRDLIVAGHQQVTHEWWAQAKAQYDLYVSDMVLAEIAGGDPSAATDRMALVRDLPVLRNNPDVDAAVRLYRVRTELAGAPIADIVHLAFAVAYRMDYLATWNCAHIANPATMRMLADVNGRQGLWFPIIVTPGELLGTG